MHIIIMKWWLVKPLKTISFCAISLESNHWNVDTNKCSELTHEEYTSLIWNNPNLGNRAEIADQELVDSDKS